MLKFLANILWFILGGFLQSLLWFLFGILWCITIIGIPVGMQCFKFAKVQLAPFGKKISYSTFKASSILLNILWIIFGGAELSAVNFTAGIALCLSIIGIPFGIQCFKLGILSLFPFGAEVS